MKIKNITFPFFFSVSITKSPYKYIGYLIISASIVLFGFLRQVYIAANFGLSPAVDVYASIFGFYLFFGNQLPTAIESTIISKYAGSKNEIVRESITSASTLISLIVVCLCLLVYWVGDFFISTILGEGLNINLAHRVALLFIPAILFSSISYILRPALYLNGNYCFGMLINVFLSVCAIISIILFKELMGIAAVPLGYSIGSILFFLAVLHFFCRTYPKKMGVRLFRSTHLKNIFFSVFLILAGELFFQIGYTVERALAIRLQEGTVSSYFYAISFLSVFITIFIAPINTVYFPRLSRKFNAGNFPVSEVNRVITVLFIFGLIIALLLSLSSNFLVKIAFVRGSFSVEDSLRTATILSVVIYVLPFMCIGRMLRYCLFAMKDFKCAVWSNFLRLILIVAFAPVLIDAYGILGLAYVYVAAGGISVIFLFFRMRMIYQQTQI